MQRNQFCLFSSFDNKLFDYTMSACGKREKLLELFKITSAASGKLVMLLLLLFVFPNRHLFPNLVWNFHCIFCALFLFSLVQFSRCFHYAYLKATPFFVFTLILFRLFFAIVWRLISILNISFKYLLQSLRAYTMHLDTLILIFTHMFSTQNIHNNFFSGAGHAKHIFSCFFFY